MPEVKDFIDISVIYITTDTGIQLSWTQDDFKTLMGYNVYRSTVEDGLYERVNTTVIPADTKEFFDDTVEPGVMYYYNFTVVKTDMNESVPSGKIALMSKDTMAPNVYHSPVYSAFTGSNLIIGATVTDNLNTCSCGESYIRDYTDETGHNTVVDTAVKETCSSTGLTEGSHCDKCGDVFVKQEIIPALPHTPGETVVENNIAPDCESNGSYDNVVYCTVCDAEVSRETIIVDALGHTPGDTVIENNIAPDCENKGSCDNVVYCTVCGAEVSRNIITVDALGHTPGDTVIENNVDPDCENSVIYPEISPTCTTEGSINGSYCSVCKTELDPPTIIPATGHQHISGIPEIAPTCSLPGNTEGSRCDDCGTIIVEPIIIPALNHSQTAGAFEDVVSPTCTQEGYGYFVEWCELCDKELSRVEISLGYAEHDSVIYDEIPATCTTNGSINGSYCSVCKAELTAPTIIPATGHQHISGIPEIVPTCISPGNTEGSKCDDCGTIIVEPIII